MNEYKVKFKARAKVLFGPNVESIEIYEAGSAKEAIEACKTDFWSRVPSIHKENVEFTIIDVAAV